MKQLLELLEKVHTQYQYPDCQDIAIRHILGYLNTLLAIRSIKTEQLEDLNEDQVLVYYFDTPSYKDLLVELANNHTELQSKNFSKFNAAKIFEQNYLSKLDRHVIKLKTSQSDVKTDALADSKKDQNKLIDLEEDIQKIEDLLVNVKEACERKDAIELKRVFSNATLILKQPLEEAYKLFPGKFSVNPYNLITELVNNGGWCGHDMSGMIYLFGEAGFNLDLMAQPSPCRPPERLLPFFVAMVHPSAPGYYNLVNVLVDFGANLNEIAPINPVLSNSTEIDGHYYLASLGAKASQTQWLNWHKLTPKRWQSYILGRTFGEDYRKLIISSLDALFPITSISMMVIDYLGKSFSIPHKKFDFTKKKFVYSKPAYEETTPPSNHSNSHVLFNSENKDGRGKLYHAAKAFDHWAKSSRDISYINNEEFDLSHNFSLLRWFSENNRINLVENYEQFMHLSIILSQKGYQTYPPTSEKEFNTIKETARALEDMRNLANKQGTSIAP